MGLRKSNKLLRRRPLIRDHRGLPAKQLCSGRRLDLLLQWANRNGIGVITEAGKAAVAVISLARQPDLLEHFEAVAAREAARQRNPLGVFTLADEVFQSRKCADRWMLDEIFTLGGRRPIDLLDTDEGIRQVRKILYAIMYGHFA